MNRAREGVTIDEALQSSVGEFGRGQQRLYLLLNYVSILTMVQVYSMVFTELNPIIEGHWICLDKNCNRLLNRHQSLNPNEVTTAFCQLSPGQWIWKNRGVSILSEFNLQCSTWKVSIADGLFFVGILFGASLFGYLADRIGRRPIMYISVLFSGLSSIANSVSPSYYWYLLFRTLTGIGCGGSGLTSFVLMSEMMGPSKRGKLLIAGQIFSSVGSCLIAGLAYLLQDWRQIMFAAGTLTIIYLFSWDATMESPRWLLVKGRKGEATAVLAAIASGNGTKLPEVPLHDMVSLPTVSRTFLQVLKNSVLRLWLFTTLLAWVSVSLSYYGVSLALEALPGSLYETFLWTVSIEFPSILFYMFMIDRVGRKPLFTWGFILGGIACAFIAFVPFWLRLSLAVFAKFNACGVFAVAYLYASELFPTVIRNATIGYASSAARIGGILAAFIPVTGRFFGEGFPFVVFGGVGILAGACCFLLPETLGVPTTETLEDMDSMITTKRKQFPFRFRPVFGSGYSIIESTVPDA
eukprot:g7587.t1